MALDWRVITATHVQQACEAVAREAGHGGRTRGLVVFAGDRTLPAKEILREAYRLAKGLPTGAEIKFSSGEATLNVLRRLGFRAERLGGPLARETRL